MMIKKHQHRWFLDDNLEIYCKLCKKRGQIESEPIRTLSLGIGIQTCYLLFRYPERYDVVIHSDIANGDREHGEWDITYWILDNLVVPFCQENNLPLWILSHPRGGVYHRSLAEHVIPKPRPRWCTQDHKVTLITEAIRKGLNASYPDNVVIDEIGFTIDESTRMDGGGSRVMYSLLDYPLIKKGITRSDCIQWLNENYPIIMNGNKIDWKDCKSGCWFCPFTPIKKLRKLSDKRKNELINLEENSTSIQPLKNKPMRIILGMDSHRLTEWSEEDELTDEKICDSGHCFV